MITGIQLDRGNSVPLYQQLYDYFADAIRAGRIAKNERLPSKRSLSTSLHISQNTVDTAYQMLAAEGLVLPLSRSGFYANPTASAFAFEASGWQSMPEQKYIFSYNDFDTAAFPVKLMGRMYRDTLEEHPDLLGHGEKGGDASLRKALAKYLFQSRGIQCSADQIVLGSGGSFLLGELLKIFPNATEIALENPCNPWIYTALSESPKTLNLFNISRCGLTMDEYSQIDADLLYLMPDHQTPTGYRMNEKQRQAALNWVAQKTSRYLIEDDYCSEYVYQTPMKSLYQLDQTGRVILYGSFAHSIAPSIKLAYLVLPESLVTKWKQTLLYYSVMTSRIEQQVLADLLRTGAVSRLIKKNQSSFLEKEQVLLAQLKTLPFYDRLTISGVGSGMHLIVTAALSGTEQELFQAALRSDVKVMPISLFSHAPGQRIPDKTFIFGYARLSAAEIEAAIQQLEQAWTSL